MLAPDHSNSFNSIPEGRRACFAILDHRDMPIQAVVLKNGRLSLFYREGLEGDIHEISIHAPEKAERLASLFECIQQDKALIAVRMADQDGLIALPAGMMQNNSIHMTANQLLGHGGHTVGEMPVDAKIIPSWLAKEIGGDITPEAMRRAIIDHAKPREQRYAL